MPGSTAVRTYTSLNASVKATFVSIQYQGVSIICTDIRLSPFDFPFQDADNHFHAHYTPTIHPKTASALNISRFQKNRKVLDASNLADAVRGCDTYVSEKVLRGPLSHA
jgi:hypothetical protein